MYEGEYTHLFWLGTYPAAGFLARDAGTPVTFTVAGVVCALLTLFAAATGGTCRDSTGDLVLR